MKIPIYSKNPTENYGKTKKNSVIFLIVVILLCSVIYLMHGLYSSVLVFLILTGIQLFELYCAKSMLSCSDAQTIENEYKMGKIIIIIFKILYM